MIHQASNYQLRTTKALQIYELIKAHKSEWIEQAQRSKDTDRLNELMSFQYSESYWLVSHVMDWTKQVAAAIHNLTCLSKNDEQKVLASICLLDMILESCKELSVDNLIDFTDRIGGVLAIEYQQ